MEGSTNQELHYLGDKYDETMEEKWASESPSEEFSIIDNTIHITGFGGQESDVLQSILASMES